MKRNIIIIIVIVALGIISIVEWVQVGSKKCPDCWDFHVDRLNKLHKEGTINELQLFDAIHGKPEIKPNDKNKKGIILMMPRIEQDVNNKEIKRYGED